MSDQTAELQLQLELSQIDLEWERDRHRYMMHTKYGQEHVPKKWHAAPVSILSVVGGIGGGIWLSVQIPAMPDIGLFVGFITVVTGLGVGLWTYSKADAYEQAEAEHLRKKEAARSKYDPA